MADVFISYSREDRARAEQVARGLAAMGLDVFWDTDIPPGKTWADYIEDKLSQCKAMVVLWSASSAGSQWVREEARMGRDTGKLIPAMLDNTPAPFGFGEVQAANLTAWRGEANHPDWMRFANAVAAAAGASPRPIPQPPPQQAQPAWSQFSSAAAAASPGATDTGGALSPIGYVQKCLRLYVNANGRARRSEYWWWTLFSVGVQMVGYIVDLGMFGFNSFTGAPNMQVVSGLLGLALVCPGVCVAVRRFHDVGLSGWWFAGALGALVIGSALAEFPALAAVGGLIALGVLIGLLVVLVRNSQPGENRFGPNPKGL